MGWSKFWGWQLHSPRSAQADGGMVTWGCRTMQISDKGSTAGAAAGCLAFASWSGPNCGCDSSRVQHLLLNVVNGKQIKQNCVTRRACAVILGDGNVVTHGDPSFGGDSSRVQDLRNVQQIYATHHAFATILADGTEVTWGNPEHGGDSSTVQDQFSYVSCGVALRITVGHTNSDNMHFEGAHGSLSTLSTTLGISCGSVYFQTWCVRFWVIRPLPAASGGIWWIWPWCAMQIAQNA